MIAMNEHHEIEIRKKLKTMFGNFNIDKKPIIDPKFITPISTDIISIIEEYIEFRYKDVK